MIDHFVVYVYLIFSKERQNKVNKIEMYTQGYKIRKCYYKIAANAVMVFKH